MSWVHQVPPRARVLPSLFPKETVRSRTTRGGPGVSRASSWEACRHGTARALQSAEILLSIASSCHFTGRASQANNPAFQVLDAPPQCRSWVD